MPGVSIHVVDVSRGVVASGMRVALYSVRTARDADAASNDSGRLVIADGAVDARGLLADAVLDATFPAGAYEAVFHVADYYRQAGIALPREPFLDLVHYRFGIADPAQHYHLPFKCTPWGYSCFRGGA